MTAALTHKTTADPPPLRDALPGDGATASPRRPAAETVRLYAADWNAFLAWCKSEGLAALPAVPATVSFCLNECTFAFSAALRRRPKITAPPQFVLLAIWCSSSPGGNRLP